jgi:hypothetical protein
MAGQQLMTALMSNDCLQRKIVGVDIAFESFRVFGQQIQSR